MLYRQPISLLERLRTILEGVEIEDKLPFIKKHEKSYIRSILFFRN